MATYEQIKKANDEIRTTDIKGKEYAEVHQRIKAFRMVHPNGSITTEIVSLENGVVLMKAKVEDENGYVIGTGFAYEKESSSFINKTSFIENCETSAVGRALGMCGYGIDTSVASAEEVENAINNQNKESATPEPDQKKATVPATTKQLSMICKLYSDEEIKKMLARMNVDSLEHITVEQASKMIASRKGK